MTEQSTASTTPPPCVSCGDPSEEVFPGGQPICAACRAIAWELFNVLPSETTTAQMRVMVREHREAQRAAEAAAAEELRTAGTEVVLTFQGRTLEWTIGDPAVGVQVVQSLVQALGPAREGEAPAEVAAPASAEVREVDHAWGLAEAIRLTVEYLGTDMLPAREGWSWYDALRSYAPVMAQRFVDEPVPMGYPLPHLSDEQTELLGAALTALHEVCLRQAVNNETAAASTYRPPQMGPVVHDNGLLRTAAQCRNRAAAAAELAELLGVGVEGDGLDEEPT